MRRLALALALATCNSGSTETSETESGTDGTASVTEAASVPESCGNGLIDPGETCDGDACDAWCQEPAFIFGANVPAFFLGNPLDDICPFVKGFEDSSRAYLPYFREDSRLPLMALSPSSTTCNLPAVTPSPWQSLTGLSEAGAADVCGHYGNSLEAWPRLWVTACIDGFAKYAAGGGTTLVPCDSSLEAIIICVAQP